MLLVLLFLFQPAIAQSMAQESPSEAFWEALRSDDVEEVVAQIQGGVSPNAINIQGTETPLTYAIKRDSIEMVTSLLDQGANPNQAQPISYFSPLMVAAKHHNAAAAEVLLCHRADPNQAGVFGRAALHIAALHDSVDVARVILDHSVVDPNARGKMCPLAIASRQGGKEFVELLLSKFKLATNSKCMDSAKNMAQLNGHIEILKLLNQ